MPFVDNTCKLTHGIFQGKGSFNPVTMLSKARSFIGETLWPTQCVLCGKPGVSLCTSCLLRLPYIDQLKACQKCGSPYGCIQCCDCSEARLHVLGKTCLPYDSCISAVHMCADTGKIVATYKDAPCKKLARVMAYIMMHVFNWYHFSSLPEQENESTSRLFDVLVTYIPSSKEACLRRGFDQSEELARTFAELAGCSFACTLDRPQSLDQRALTRIERFVNMGYALHVLPQTQLQGKRIVLVDDVCTTGATLFAASEALRGSEAAEIHCVTFARS